MDEQSRDHCVYGYVICSVCWEKWIKLTELLIWEGLSKVRFTTYPITHSGFSAFFVGCLCAKREKEYGVLHYTSVGHGYLVGRIQLICSHVTGSYLAADPGFLTSLSDICALSEKRNTASFIRLASPTLGHSLDQNSLQRNQLICSHARLSPTHPGLQTSLSDICALSEKGITVFFLILAQGMGIHYEPKKTAHETQP